METRDQLIALGMIESESKTIGGIKMRPFSIGSRQIADLLNISMIYGEAVSEVELLRQINTFAWMQSAPVEEVAEAIANARHLAFDARMVCGAALLDVAEAGEDCFQSLVGLH